MSLNTIHILDGSCSEGSLLTNTLKRSLRSLQSILLSAVAGTILILSSCGGGQYTPAPITLSVSLNNKVITLQANGMPLNISVTIVAPTETATFTIKGLPPGVSESYKESESNPSGLLTLTASPSTDPGTYTPTIIVGSSGQSASLGFTLVVTASH